MILYTNKIVFFLCAFSCGMPFCGAQDLNEIFKNSTNFYDIESRANEYFKEDLNKNSKAYKHYMRWYGEMQFHVDESGVIKNTNAAHYQASKKWNKQKLLNRSTHGSWSDVGPFDYTGGDAYSGGGVGRVNCTAFHPSNSNIFWVGTANGGVWKTTNDGNTWTPMTDAFSSIGISAIVVDPTDADIIYILTGDGDGSPSASEITQNSSIGVLKTDDGGINWRPTSLSFSLDSLKYGYDMIGNPQNSNVLFAGFRNDGIYRTSNGGQTWANVEIGRTIWDIEYAPGDTLTMYAASDDGLLVSDNGGLVWTLENDPNFPAIGTFDRMELAMSPSAASNVYAVFGGNMGPGIFNGVYKSSDFGQNFTLRSNSPNILGSTTDGGGATSQSWYDLTIVVDPQDDSKVFVGAVNCWKSENSGATWGRETWWTKNYEPFDPYVHADWHNMYFRGSTLYANVDGGIYRSTDYGNDWQDLTKGLSIMQFYEIEILGNKYLGGAQDNGTNEADDTNIQCKNLVGGDGFGGTWHTTNNSIQYLSTQDRLARRQFESNVFIWEEANGFWRNDIKMHRTNADFFFFDKGNELFRANQNGEVIWDYHFDSLKTNNAFSGGGEILGYDQGYGTNDNVMYVVNRSNILKTTNLASDNPIWSIKTDPSGLANISDIIVSPHDPNEIWLTCSSYIDTSKVYYSTNGGDDWENITGTLPNVPVRCITYHEGTNNGVYIGMDLGIFYRDAGMYDWVFFSNHIPNSKVVDIEISGNNVYAGTHGRGIWKSQTYSSCPGSITLTQANDPSNPLSIGQQQYHALTSIISTRKIQGTTAEIFYNSGSYIDMKPGFVAKRESFMEAKVAGCLQ